MEVGLYGAALGRFFGECQVPPVQGTLLLVAAGVVASYDGSLKAARTNYCCCFMIDVFFYVFASFIFMLAPAGTDDVSKSDWQ